MNSKYIYNLSIYTVDGSIYGLISSDMVQLHKFLLDYDHEGSSVSLVERDYVAGKLKEIDPDDIYRFLSDATL